MQFYIHLFLVHVLLTHHSYVDATESKNDKSTRISEDERVGVLMQNRKKSKVSSHLLRMADGEDENSHHPSEEQDPFSRSLSPHSGSFRKLLRVDSKGFVAIEAIGYKEATSEVLTSLGCTILSSSDYLVSAQCHPAVLHDPRIEDNDAIKAVVPVLALAYAGEVESEASTAMFVDQARAEFGIDGAGIKVGIMSDSFDFLNGASADVASGDLPVVEVLVDYLENDAIDEGRAMAQLVHDVAPGANIAYRTAFKGQPDFAQGIKDLEAAGCNVIVDDIGYFLAPWFQDGMIAQAATAVAKNGIPFFSAAGNFGTNSWEGVFNPITFTAAGFNPKDDQSNTIAVNTDATLHDFGDGKFTQTWSCDSACAGSIVFQWDDVFFSENGAPGATQNFELWFLDSTTQEVLFRLDDAVIGANPTLLGTISDSFKIDVAIVKTNKLPETPHPRMKWILFNPSSSFEADPPTNAGTCIGHPNSDMVAGIGASFWDDSPGYGTSPAIQEAFTSSGGTPILRSIDGAALANPIVREQPLVTGPDGVSTTFFGEERAGFDNKLFFGTSAAAPNVAAVAALMMDAASKIPLSNSAASNAKLSPTMIYEILKATALDMDDTATLGEFDEGYDTGTGHGFVDGKAAIRTAASFYCPIGSFMDPDGDFKCTFVASPLPACGDASCAEAMCKILARPIPTTRNLASQQEEGVLELHSRDEGHKGVHKFLTDNSLRVSSSGLRGRNLVVGNCPAGFIFDREKRVCFEEDECMRATSPCSSDDGSYCVDHNPDIRFECGCARQFFATGYPEATTTMTYKDEVVDAIIEEVMSESGTLFNYTVPIKFRPTGCDRLPTNAPSKSPSAAQNEGGVVVAEDQCLKEYGRVCREENGEYCGTHTSAQDGTATAACLCLDGWEKILGLLNRGCQPVDKCASTEWNICDEHATCVDQFPGTTEPVFCVCDKSQGFVGGGHDCIATQPPSQAPSTSPSNMPSKIILTDKPVSSPPPPCPVGATRIGGVCRCPSGEANFKGVCELSRPGAVFESSTNACIFTECPGLTGFIEIERVAGKSVTCQSIIYPGCDAGCAETNCLMLTGAVFNKGGSTGGESWHTPLSCTLSLN